MFPCKYTTQEENTLLLFLAIFLTISQVKTAQGTVVGFSDAANNNNLLSEPLTAVGVILWSSHSSLQSQLEGHKGSAIPSEQRQVLSPAEVSAH